MERHPPQSRCEEPNLPPERRATDIDSLVWNGIPVIICTVPKDEEKYYNEKCPFWFAVFPNWEKAKRTFYSEDEGPFYDVPIRKIMVYFPSTFPVERRRKVVEEFLKTVEEVNEFYKAYKIVCERVGRGEL